MSSHKSILSFTRPTSNTGSDYVLGRNLEEKTKDLWEVKTVPNNFESVSKPSKIIENLFKKKKEQHETSLNQMNKELCEIQKNCAQKIKDLSEILLKNIAGTRKDIEDIKRKFGNDISRYTTEGCKSTKIKLIKKLTKELVLINEFNDQLKIIERNRSVEVKKILSKYLDTLSKIAYTIPEKIQVLTEDELKKYNNSVLDNYEIYETVCLKMKLNNHKLKSELGDWVNKIKIRKSKQDVEKKMS